MPKERETKEGKAQRFTEQQRVRFSAISRSAAAATVAGDGDDYRVEFQRSKWSCTCKANHDYGRICAHITAARDILRAVAPALEERDGTNH
jgi:hypothetical protein